MCQKINFYYFSPTGGTQKVGATFVETIGKEITAIDLGDKKQKIEMPQRDLNVVAAPVFGGRIPALVSEKMRMVKGENKPVVSIVVYGTRAYEDALLELNHVLTEVGFSVIASGAFVAQHSMAPEIGQGRPDAKDLDEIRNFAGKVQTKIENHENGKICVPGKEPYKPEMKVVAAPISLDNCTLCGKCEKSCPTDAIRMEQRVVKTELSRCILCGACIKACPENARILPPPVQKHVQELLAPLKNVRRENEIFL